MIEKFCVLPDHSFLVSYLGRPNIVYFKNMDATDELECPELVRHRARPGNDKDSFEFDLAPCNALPDITITEIERGLFLFDKNYWLIYK